MSVVAAILANIAIWTTVAFFAVLDIQMVAERVRDRLTEHREECDRCRARAIRRRMHGRHAR